MSQHYSDPSREHDKWSLPDLEVFYACEGNLRSEDDEPLPAGWYWWSCFPGCLPDSPEPNGPFESEEAALDAARYLLGDS